MATIPLSMRPPGRKVPEIAHEHVTASDDEYDLEHLIADDQELAHEEGPPRDEYYPNINIDADTGGAPDGASGEAATKQGASENDQGSAKDDDDEHESDNETHTQDNTDALNILPGKRRRITTSARWENNALRHFKRRFDDDAEREDSVPWKRQRVEKVQDTQHRTKASDAGAQSDEMESGVTRDRENACTRTGVT